ncbi:hypothetical protein BUALT_Bualt19G0059600 [Buddleja alternifolia]|uniref:RING-type domain-containing protein n=1 Tax=Buddleja alternifolia TaxID=168488 RepID=A0AAV6W7G9_9LAMI|nr:hypothetical protein BUALT_Bualt19G0059600 [Buddleja alternifolia]
MMAKDESLRGSSSDPNPNPNPCPICLSTVTQESYLDHCFHRFCYSCIIRWSNVSASKQLCAQSSLKCPLCKTQNFSIIHGYDGTSFQQHYFSKSVGNSEFFSEAHRYRLKCYYTEPGDLADKLHVSRYWKSRKYLQQNLFLPGWLRREIQALMQEEDVDIIMHHILGVIDSLRRDWLNKSRISSEMIQEELRMLVSEAVRPFLTGRTERFVKELELFLASGLSIDAFDKVYMKHLGWKVVDTSEEDDDDRHAEEEPLEHAPAVPYLYILDEDSDRN